jgi:cytosine/uracil/thiamine/allantoin permease
MKKILKSQTKFTFIRFYLTTTLPSTLKLLTKLSLILFYKTLKIELKKLKSTLTNRILYWLLTLKFKQKSYHQLKAYFKTQTNLSLLLKKSLLIWLKCKISTKTMKIISLIRLSAKNLTCKTYHL